MRSLVIPLLLAAAPLAAAPRNAPAPKAAQVSGEHGGDPELQSLRRQLASAVLVAELKLTPEQKTSLKAVLVEARKAREELKSDAKIADVRADRKVALQSAIDEVHAKGSLSEKTKESLKDGGRDAMKDMGEVREKMKSFRESVIGILTPEQIDHMKELRAERAKKFKAFGKGGKGGGKAAGKQRLMHLVLSDEFAAELDR